jgi:hypothetical protein
MGDDAGRDIGDISLLAENSSPEDAGAETQSRFRYQHECTVRSCIPLLLAKKVTAVVCEEHEDFVVFYEDALPELVSVKHREVSQGLGRSPPFAATVGSNICSTAGRELEAKQPVGL